jgi:hypothetical protein
MNYVILIGIALYFVVTALRGGAMGWRFDDGRMSFRVADGAETVRVRVDGDVDLEPDGSGVAALSSRGSLDVVVTQNGANRRVRFFQSIDGEILRQFFVDGDEQPWNPEADRLVTEVMPIVLRETALNVEERVAWLLANRGQTGVLDEIDLIRSDFAQRLYTVEYARAADIAPADFDRLMRAIRDNMSSDFDARTTLTAVFDEEMPTGAQFVALLEAGERISSDFDARSLLEHVAPRMPPTSEAARAYLALARTISSDFDMRSALHPLVTNPDAPDELVAGAMELAGSDISSDFDVRALLADGARRVGRSDAIARAYTSASTSISNDFDQREALSALARDAQLSPVGWRLLLRAAHGISSDFDLAELLVGAAPSLPDDESVVEAYREALETISSDFDYGRAVGALRRADGA